LDRLQPSAAALVAVTQVQVYLVVQVAAVVTHQRLAVLELLLKETMAEMGQPVAVVAVDLARSVPRLRVITAETAGPVQPQPLQVLRLATRVAVVAVVKQKELVLQAVETAQILTVPDLRRQQQAQPILVVGVAAVVGMRRSQPGPQAVPVLLLFATQSKTNTRKENNHGTCSAYRGWNRSGSNCCP
jgi:hypothetical protein